MPESFSEQLELFTHHATESEVVVEVRDISQGRIRSIHGQLRGPRCAKAKTLSASFAIDRCTCDAKISQSASVLVTEPCYWSPELPMLYDIELELELAGGETATWRRSLGLRQCDIHGRDLFRGRKRIVLRGAVVENASIELLARAADAELALVVRDSDTAFLQRASELGVPLAVDLRGFVGDLTPTLLRFTWQPAIELVLLSNRVTGADFKPRAVRAGSFVDAALPSAAGEGVDVLSWELGPRERLPSWAATCAKPVIAIRRAGPYADLSETRRGCDLLQAELAPEFDLAGYFV
jgi:Glycosyl hydrolases family 2